jgi:DNA polymerase-3 subunit delta
MARTAAAQDPGIGTDAPIVVLHGKEAFLRLDRTRALRDALAAVHGEIETLRFDGERDRPADVLDECRSVGLLQQHKLVVVDEADQFVKGESRPIVERYAESPVPGATLVLRCETWNKGKLDTLITGCGGALVACEPLAPAAAVAWAVARASGAHAAALPREAAQLLVERAGCDLGRIDSELAKLALGAAGGRITPEQVAELVGLTREEQVWSIQEPMLAGDPERLLITLRTILDNARTDQTVVTFFAAMDLCRKLHAASRGVQQRMPPAEIAKRLKLWGPGRDAILDAARRIDPRTAAALLTKAVEADRRSKSGLGDPQRILERLSLQIAAGAHR